MERHNGHVKSCCCSQGWYFLSQRNEEYEIEAIAKGLRGARIVYNAYAVQKNGIQTISCVLQDQAPFNGFVEKSKHICSSSRWLSFGMPKLEEFGSEAYYFSPILLSRLPVVLEDEDLSPSKTPSRLFHTCPGSWLASIGFQIPVF